MNKPSQPRPPFEATSPPYELDGYGWAKAQARLLSERRFEAVDLANIIEEIESVGKRERSTVRSALRVLMMHILKWQHQPERRSRSWALSIASQRLAYQDAIGDNPSLKGELDAIRTEAYRRSRIEAAAETDLPLRTFSETPLEWQVILDQKFELPDA
ncbi:MAG: DUF29 domain-containing protein [Proteobacteria bacterium]|nr:DUF29 domain-containing protein [Pseudomonadota bacterium]